jgi:diketogulonate reductase-like aldo/keto reductase
VNVPAIGFGTAPYREGNAPLDLEPAVRSALAAGFRLFDLAESYGNERAVGRALRSADAPPRKELCLIGKVWMTNYRPDDLRRACEASLERLGIDRFDFYLLHAPGALRRIATLDDAEEIGWDELRRRAYGASLTDDVPLAETWTAMQRLVSDGLAARIGTSNFAIDQVDGLPNATASEVPCWPFKSATLEAHRRREITVFGYSPLRRNLDGPRIRSVASTHGRTPQQVVLSWLIHRGVRPLTSSTNPRHIRENIEAARLALSAEELKALESELA